MRIHVWHPNGEHIVTGDSREHILVVLATDEEKERLIDADNEALLIFPAGLNVNQVKEIITRKVE